MQLLRLFLKDLKDGHTLAAHVYEKSPQTLADAITEVERLKAAQQLTTSLLPPSTVNTMSTEDERCYQCQALGHMA